MQIDLNEVAEALKCRGYDTVVVKTPEDAKEVVLAEAQSAASVAWGGSETLKEIGVKDALSAAGKEVRDHALEADLFLLSANALTADGRIVNIDGRGNRVAASIAGPKRVIYVIGRNKIVTGGVDEAIARIKREACPANTRRLGKRTPCALTGECNDCDSPDRICKVTVIFDRCPGGMPTKVILVDAVLGY